MDKRLEFWNRRHTEARTALEISQAHLLRIQAVGQLSLFADQKPDPLATRRGEVIPIRPSYDDLIA